MHFTFYVSLLEKSVSVCLVYNWFPFVCLIFNRIVDTYVWMRVNVCISFQNVII